jgi:hypothetical protein
MTPPRRPPLRDLAPRPTRGPRPAAPPLARAASALVADLARKTRFVDPDLAARWTELAGPELSKLCRPGRLTGGVAGRTLEVIVPHGAAAASVEFAAETLCRRLNSYFGPNAIERIAIIQGGAPTGDPRPQFSRFRSSDH